MSYVWLNNSQYDNRIKILVVEDHCIGLKTIYLANENTRQIQHNTGNNETTYFIVQIFQPK